MAVMMRTMLEVADNSGARKLQMILPLGGATGLRAGLGDVITASVKEAAPDGQANAGAGARRYDATREIGGGADRDGMRRVQDDARRRPRLRPRPGMARLRRSGRRKRGDAGAEDEYGAHGRARIPAAQVVTARTSASELKVAWRRMHG